MPQRDPPSSKLICRVARCVRSALLLVVLTPFPLDAAELYPVTSGDLVALVEQPGAEATLVNVWATWCLPCLEELPDLIALRREYAWRGVRVLLVSGDFPDEREHVLSFLEENGVDFPTYLKDEADMPFIAGLNSDWSGALPLTLVYDREARLILLHEGKARRAQFVKWIERALSGPVDRNDPATEADQEESQ